MVDNRQLVLSEAPEGVSSGHIRTFDGNYAVDPPVTFRAMRGGQPAPQSAVHASTLREDGSNPSDLFDGLMHQFLYDGAPSTARRARHEALAASPSQGACARRHRVQCIAARYIILLFRHHVGVLGCIALVRCRRGLLDCVAGGHRKEVCLVYRRRCCESP